MLSHRDALRADFRRYYQLNFDEVGRAYSISYAADLAAWLPDDAAIWRAIDPRATWDTTQQLLANVADATAFLAWTKSKDASHKGARWKGALKRPGAKQERKQSNTQALTAEEFNKRLAAAKRKYSHK